MRRRTLDDQERALLHAIRAHREDDLPRLVYADWLDERGDHDRAEFTRLSCWLSARPPEHPDWALHSGREAELLLRHQPQWDLPLNGYVHLYGRHYDRGFPSWFSVHGPADFAEVASELIEASAVDRLRIGWSFDDTLVPLLFCPGLAEIKDLVVNVEGRALSPLSVEHLLSCEFTQQLRRLDLTGTQFQYSQYDAELLARSPVLPDLQYAHLGYFYSVDLDTAAPLVELIESPHRKALRGLEVWYLSEAAVIELATCPGLSRFTHLDLGYSRVTDAAAIRLAESPHLDGIQLLTPIGEGEDLTSHGLDALRERFGDRVELDPLVYAGSPTKAAYVYRVITGRRFPPAVG